MREVPGLGPPTFSPDVNIQNVEGLNKRVPLTVNISLTEFEVVSVAEVNHKFTAKFVLTYEWFERRIVWHNLKKLENQNELPERKFEQVFVPTLIFRNTKTRQTSQLDGRTKVFGRLKGNLTKSEPEELEEVALYPGTDNPIVYSRYYYLELTENFNLLYYPFDEQLMVVELGPTQPGILVMAGVIEYSGPTSMRRFTVMEWRIEEMASGPRLRDRWVGEP